MIADFIHWLPCASAQMLKMGIQESLCPELAVLQFLLGLRRPGLFLFLANQILLKVFIQFRLFIVTPVFYYSTQELYFSFGYQGTIVRAMMEIDIHWIRSHFRQLILLFLAMLHGILNWEVYCAWPVLHEAQGPSFCLLIHAY